MDRFLRPPKPPAPAGIPRDQLAGVRCALCKGEIFRSCELFRFAFNRLDPNQAEALLVDSTYTCAACGAAIRRRKDGGWTTAWRCVCPELFPTEEKLREHLELEHVELKGEAIDRQIEKER